ncbi:Cof-type HAD-IIB family hydrolase [Companilactobacillus mindensis]|nr:Cof-type HAD-IIB family hydrolase [Companilactobacillus mindensis]GEO77753.1 haloacid dehalogenase [Companilactobacillus mindensis]
MIKLIATDMDGTFLRDDMTYDEAKFDKLYQKLQSQQIQFVVASGNQYFQLKSFFKKYPDIIYISENGALIRQRDNTLSKHSFTKETVQTVLEKLQAISNLKLLVCGEKSAYTLTTTDPKHVKKMRNYYHHLDVIENFDQIDDDVLKFAITCPDEQTDEIVETLKTALKGLAEPTSSGHGDIDVIQLGMNKAAGLKELGKILDIDLSEMMAFGDGGNDLEMLREVGWGVAMENAQPKVTAVADQTTADNQNQGVLQKIEEFLAN